MGSLKLFSIGTFLLVNQAISVVPQLLAHAPWPDLRCYPHHKYGSRNFEIHWWECSDKFEEEKLACRKKCTLEGLEILKKGEGDTYSYPGELTKQQLLEALGFNKTSPSGRLAFTTQEQNDQILEQVTNQVMPEVEKCEALKEYKDDVLAECKEWDAFLECFENAVKCRGEGCTGRMIGPKKDKGCGPKCCKAL